jgi:DNA helicase-2/ATP-dependent DNA helicase PcrA
MNDAEHQSEIANEAAVEARYSEGRIQKERDYRDSHARTVTPNKFTGKHPTDPITRSELIGRVKLSSHNEVVEAEDFYIGTENFVGDAYRVYPWTAPIARTFYRNAKPQERGAGAVESVFQDVVGVRAFTHHLDQINDLQDEWLDGEHLEATMFARAPLNVPRPPSRPESPLPGPASNVPTAEPAVADVSPVQAETHAAVGQSPLPAVPPRPPSQTGSKFTAAAADIPGPPIRTAELLRRQLAAAKESAMSAVLATLQPDQYEVITALATENQILQGHPGTGKTIVAVHRAAYLLSEPHPDEPDDARARGRVLVIGPTEEYVSHVSNALRKLIPDASRFNAVALPGLLEDLAGLPRTSTPTETSSYLDVDLGLAVLVDRACARVMAASEWALDAGAVYAALVGFLKDPPDGVLEEEWAQYLKALPKQYADFRRERRRAHRGLMAYLGVKSMEQRPRYGHIIVDESQDIHPLEWEVLARFANDGGWTILGDVNQRRTDHTFASWDKVAERLAIDVEGKAPVQVLERGYRSTAQIMHFANHLLPPNQRSLYSLQKDGEAPKLRHVTKPVELFEVALNAAIELHDLVSPGTTAIIAADHEGMRNLMPRKGWQADRGESSTWRDGDRTLRVLPAERARGLEFDAVVVVEPASFPQLFGRKGVLYTALTRANRLLTVVYHRALPDLKLRTR